MFPFKFPIAFNKRVPGEYGAGKTLNIIYALDDQFTDTVPAGSANGTQATPTGGIRTVTDTNNKISIGSGFFNFATGSVANDGIWYSSYIRTVGKVLAGELIGTNSQYYFGWDTNQVGAPATSLGFVSGSVMRFGTVLTVGTPPAASALTKVWIILRSSGGYGFIQEATAYPQIELVWAGESFGNSPMYPCCVGVQTTTVFQMDNVRVPDTELYLPYMLAYDTFTRASLGSTETSGPDGQGVPSLPWTSNVGTAGISSNQIKASALAGGVCIATVEGGIPDVHCILNLTRGTDTVGIVTNYADANNFIYAIHNGTNASLHKVVGGVDSALINSAAAYSAGKRIYVKTRISSGSLLARLFYNDAAVGTEQTIADAALVAATKHGFYATDTDSVGDAFHLYPTGQEGHFSALSRFLA